MILVSFTNMYLSGIHLGIQTAHVTHTMMRKYMAPGPSDKDVSRGMDQSDWDRATATLLEWEENHKTIYVKRGGDHDGLWSLYGAIADLCRPLCLPFARWAESKGALNGAMTAVAFVAPASVLDCERSTRAYQGMGSDLPEPLSPQMKLARMIHGAPFAS